MQKIYFIRHGQASFGAQNYDQLSSLGLKQAAVLGQYIAALCAGDVGLISGSMHRHQQTAQIALAQHASSPVVVSDPQWNEFDHQQVFARYNPDFANPARLLQEMQAHPHPAQRLEQIFSAALQRWMDPAYAQDYSENGQLFQQRVRAALSGLIDQMQQKQQQQAVVFSSAGVISAVCAQVLQLPAEKMAELMFVVANCSVSAIQVIDQQLHLQVFNEHHFLATPEHNLISLI
jgi:broad specificity phosphatase PhoE